jgi:hypothetical protein
VKRPAAGVSHVGRNKLLSVEVLEEGTDQAGISTIDLLVLKTMDHHQARKNKTRESTTTNTQVISSNVKTNNEYAT